MKKIIRLAMLLLLTAGMFAGCGKKKQAEPTETVETIPSVFVLEDLNITAENVFPYDGLYLEAGEKESVSGIYAMKFTNTGDQTILDAQLVFNDGKQELSYHIEMLPAGKTVIVACQEKMAANPEEMNFVDGTLTLLDAGLENTQCVEVTGGADGAMVVKNTTQEPLPLIRVFYRYTDGNGNLLGGPCYSALIDGLSAGETATPEAEQWTKDSAVVTVLVIDE